jgi:hypothetical protein
MLGITTLSEKNIHVFEQKLLSLSGGILHSPEKPVCEDL